MAKKYKLGLFIGRFQPFHKGHEMIVKKALEQCDKLVILVGSAQESMTLKNPFSVKTRSLLIEGTFFDEVREEKIIILPIPDRDNPSNDSSWGEYIIKFLDANNIPKPNVIFEGKETEREAWYDTLGIERVVLSRNNIKVSGTKFRNEIMKNNRNYWDMYKCSGCDTEDFTFLREMLLFINEKEN